MDLQLIISSKVLILLHSLINMINWLLTDDDNFAIHLHAHLEI